MSRKNRRKKVEVVAVNTGPRSIEYLGECPYCFVEVEQVLKDIKTPEKFPATLTLPSCPNCYAQYPVVLKKHIV